MVLLDAGDIRVRYIYAIGDVAYPHRLVRKTMNGRKQKTREKRRERR